MSALNFEKYDIDLMTQEFIDQFKISGHKDLKRVEEFKAIEDKALKRKIYDRTRYKLRLVSNEQLQPESDLPLFEYIHELERKKAKEKQEEDLKSKDTILTNPLNFLKIFILGFIFVFLASESIKFYEQFEIHPFFKYSLPIVIESSILVLSLKKKLLPWLLVIFLIGFNISASIFRSIDQDKNKQAFLSNQNLKSKLFNEEKKKLEIQIKDLGQELKILEAEHSKMIGGHFFKIAKENLEPKMESKNLYLKTLREKEFNINQDILNLGEIKKASVSFSNLSLNTILIIVFKFCLQIVFIFFVFDLKKEGC